MEDSASIPLPSDDANELLDFEFEEISYSNNRFMIADEDQGRVVQEEVELPLVLGDFAGAGKTSTALSFLREALRRDNARVLYVARSQGLVAKVKRDFSSDTQLEESLGSAAAAAGTVGSSS